MNKKAPDILKVNKYHKSRYYATENTFFNTVSSHRQCCINTGTGLLSSKKGDTQKMYGTDRTVKNPA